MRILGLEEHFVTSEVLDARRATGQADRDLAFNPSPFPSGGSGRLLLDVGEERLAVMDETWLDVAVRSRPSRPPKTSGHLCNYIRSPPSVSGAYYGQEDGTVDPRREAAAARRRVLRRLPEPPWSTEIVCPY